jgi:hypothetical protein
MQKFSTVLSGIVIIAAILACNMPSSQQDPGAIMTEAALTVQAQLSSPAPSGLPATATFTAVAFPTLPPSTAPIPTLPPAATPTVNCDNASFLADITYPDNTVVSAGDNFTKTWRFRNIGTCSWTPSYALVFMSGESMGGPSAQALSGNVNPGQTVDISAALTAPSSNGTHVGNWGIRNAAGVIFAHFYVQIKVGSGGGSSGGAFAVIHVTYTYSTWSDSGHTNCPRVIAHITTNGAGSVTYHWTRSDSSSASTETLTFSSAGTQSINYDWALGSVWNGTTSWVGIYIDDPNHQDFGHKEFTTACTSP